ncbi:MAG TPA: DUF1476 domain-containing protein [Alphaproteobacteria bacterium]|nr:DUF1476 domain-containing protein [Alphaproteobacteria bacterium]USO04779.1 MAG: DUF1476 domain-containing protein [Rhodospirillales bacterium]HOO81092.1 DUF1476 domain-containing protein [Alphaproteobacteria bacterium]
MSSFDERKDAFENKFAHEEKLDFAVEARCSKLFGLWVAEQFGLEGADAKTYAMEVVESNLEEPGFDDVLRKVKGDLEGKDIEISDHMLNTQLDIALEKARKQIKEEGA